MRFKKIYIEINNTCNFNCSFCIHTNREKKYLSLEEFKKIITEIKPYTNYVYLHIMGEPLLHPNLNEFISICKENKIKVNLTTNGSLLLKNINIFLNNEVRQLNISLHSIEKENQFFYQYIDNVLTAIRQINDNTETYISLRLWNVENEKNSRQKYILNKLNNIYNRDFSNLDFKDFKNYTISKNLFLSMDKKFIWPSLNNEFFSEKGTCHGLNDMCGILVDGTVVPCCLDANGDIKLGNIFKTPFSKIIESEQTINILNGFKNNNLICKLCQKCQFRTRFDK